MKKKLPKDISIILLGDTGVGKTSIFIRYSKNKFTENYISTISADFERKNIEYKNKTYSFRIYDTAGQERFRSIAKSYFHFADCFIIIFDLTNKVSLISVPTWIDLIKDFNENPLFIILGNKNDLKNSQIPQAEIEQVIQNINNFNEEKFFKVSAKSGDNINEAFYKMIDLIENNKDNINEENNNHQNLNINNKNTNQMKCC